MICTNCGARLMDTDQFCPKCGAKAIKDRRCPDCGAVLREGTKFCHKCGRLVGGDSDADSVSDETLDIPIDAIEKNILTETAAEIKADRRTGSAPRRERPAAKSPSAKSTVHSSTSKGTSSKGTSAKSTSPNSSMKKAAAQKSGQVKKKAAEPEPRRRSASPEPPRKKRTVYRDEDWDDEDWEDEDWDDDEEGVDIITVMTAIVGCVLLVVVAVLGFNLYKQHLPKNYDKAAQEETEGDEEEEQTGQENESGQEEQNGQEVEISQDTDANDGRESFTLTVIHDNVNVRDHPSTSGTNVLKKAQDGETYTCYGSVGDGQWYEVLLEDGSTGYIFYEYISVD